jgi:hypothetical protein
MPVIPRMSFKMPARFKRPAPQQTTRTDIRRDTIAHQKENKKETNSPQDKLCHTEFSRHFYDEKQEKYPR